jgi:hypothetical protein
MLYLRLSSSQLPPLPLPLPDPDPELVLKVMIELVSLKLGPS